MVFVEVDFVEDLGDVVVGDGTVAKVVHHFEELGLIDVAVFICIDTLENLFIFCVVLGFEGLNDFDIDLIWVHLVCVLDLL